MEAPTTVRVRTSSPRPSAICSTELISKRTRHRQMVRSFRVLVRPKLRSDCCGLADLVEQVTIEVPPIAPSSEAPARPMESTQPLLALALGLSCLLSGPNAAAAERTASPKIDFRRDVLPILSDKCFHCHGPDSSTREADLRLDQKGSLYSLEEGRAVIAPGSLENSELWNRISSHDADIQMPPPDQTRQLRRREREVIRRWIETGAEWSGHWAFEPPILVEPPPVEDSAWVRTPVDRFVLSKLEQQKLPTNSEADRESIIRRVTLDLTGLPPTPADVDAFLSDTRPGAYERVVDRLLASPRYGEHMAIPWLDASRYADTDGYQNDRLRYMWVWRDWLLMALNENMPFDQFTVEQLAGDLLPDPTLYQQVATGFGRNHRINSEGGSIPDEWAVEYVVDRVDTLGTVWLGLTMGCARCHDHKYDPVTQRDYYGLFAFFNNVPEWGLGPNNGNSPPFIQVPESWPNLKPGENRLITPAPYELKTTQTSVVRPLPGGPKTVMVLAEMSEPRPTYLLKRGQYNQPDKSEVLPPSLPDQLGLLPESLPQNRMGLARWLVSEENPLTARVIVNRYWQLFFGDGIVRTSDNFGLQGEPPTHAELLDWLALEFQRSGWNVKHMHRLIVTSATYRQSSHSRPDIEKIDPRNSLLARGPRLRLSAQMIRDQSLAASGLLVERLGGAPVKPYMPPGIWRSISNNKYQQDHGAALYRRSLYTYWRRTLPPPTMMTFNSAEREVCLVRKDQTNSPLQALTLMNNVTFVESARKMAERVLTSQQEGSSDESTLQTAFQFLTSRSPDAAETEQLLQALNGFRAAFEKTPAAAQQLLKTGESSFDRSLKTTELAAWTLVCSAIMNLDEVITR